MQPHEARPGTDVGNHRLARLDDARQRIVERVVADPVGDQRAVIFDAHGIAI